MKIKLAFVILMLMPGVTAAQDKMADQLRKAIVEEEGNQNLDKAIQAYQSILSQFNEERKTAATALFHLADCYRKQGKKDQAIAAYKRVLQEFPDQSKLAAASQGYLTKTFGISQNTAAAAAADEEKYLPARQRYRDSLLQEMKLVESQIEAGEKRVVVGVSSKEEIIPLRKELLELQRTLAAFDAGALPFPASSGPGRQMQRWEPVVVDANIMEAKLLKKVAPVCPEVAVRGRMEGVVRLSVTINEQGEVASVKVIGGGYPPLQPAAAEAVKQWRYSPYIDATGQAIPVITTVNLAIKCPSAP